MRQVPVVYDLNMRKVAYLENAFTVGYEQPMNGLHKAHFTLPANDPKNAECLPMRFVELYENGERLDLFRIMPNTARRSSDGQTITYECEHVLGTLIDDVLFQFHTIGGLGVYTDEVIEYLLSRQTTKRWKLGTVAIRRQFEYTWENENLYNALRSVPAPFVEEYMWTWDTSSYPWTMNLVEPPDEVTAHIRYGFNLRGIERTIDPRNLCTRLYGLGYGEGVNQLNFAEINNGKPYLDADTQAQFGIISDIFVDRRFEQPETLKARCEAILNERKMPRISYSVQAADLSALSDAPLHKFVTGAKARIIDEELGIDVIARVVNKRKPDYNGQPGDVELEIANKPVDVAGMFAEMETKQRINDLYAQGATNIDTQNFADNCDPDHPAILRIWIPEGTVRINKVSLTYHAEPYRAYERAIEAAPATTSGPSSTSTTAGGGGVFGTDTDVQVLVPGLSQDYTAAGGADNHTHRLYNHAHRIYLPDHTHGMNHTHEIPSHTHGIDYGIFEGPTHTVVTVAVDGNAIPNLGVSESEVDLIPYMSVDSEGKIRRGQWHEITVTPNGLGRIAATVAIQLFVQSRGGGNY